MKCPKCHYLSFDPEPRCKNCGYDLEVADADLAFRAAEEADQSLPDLPLRDEMAAGEAPMTLELVRSAKLPHPDDPPRPKPAPKRPRVVVREPAMAGAPRRSRSGLPPALPPREPVAPLDRHLSEEPQEPAPDVAARSIAPLDPLVPLTPLVPIKPAEPETPPVRPLPELAEFNDEDEESSDMAPAPETGLRLIPIEPQPSAPSAPIAARAQEPPAPESAPLVTFPEPQPVDPPHVDPPKTAPPTSDLPLFVRQTAGRDTSLESPAEAFMRQAASRPPLVVRRPVEPSRPQQPPAYVQRQAPRRPGPLDHDLLEDLRRVEREEAAAARAAELAARAASGGQHEALADLYDVAASQRLTAAALDGLLLGGIGSFVLWATLKVTGVPATAFGIDAIIPLAIFLSGVGVSYLLMFTLAGGQTLGKMLAGIRVVPEDDPSERVSFRQAAGRALLAPLSILALGVGWWPALFGRAALHDRLVHTRVVRA